MNFKRYVLSYEQSYMEASMYDNATLDDVLRDAIDNVKYDGHEVKVWECDFIKGTMTLVKIVRLAQPNSDDLVLYVSKNE